METLENVFEVEEWDSYGPTPAGWCSKPRRLVRSPGRSLTASVYVLDPGEKHLPYHFHHGAEELLIVLEGMPTLRTPEGERTLRAGDVAHFPRGAEGAHQVRNESDAPARFVVTAANTTPELVEYPDAGKIAAMALTPSQRGERIWTMHFLENETGYWDREA
ncbi:MAG TPA: cupin domain-containing protein [Gaiellaceae bacterium]|jgi:uncharacterized cupin superfamily protein